MAVMAATACAPASAGSVELSCAISGAQYVGSPDEICAAFQSKIHDSIGQPVTQAKNFAESGGKDAINIDLRVLKRGGIVAIVKQRKNGVVNSFPEIAIDVMDRPLAIQDVETLATEVAKLVASSAN